VKRLILIRHAKSSWKETGVPDFERPLNKRGKEDAPRMGRRLADRGYLPDLIISSPAKRAVSTVKRIAREIGIPKQEMISDTRLYEALAPDMLRVIRGVDDQYGSVAICGHNPGLTDLCSLLSGRCMENIPTCGVVVLVIDVQSWKDVSSGTGEITCFDYPKRTAGPSVDPAGEDPAAEGDPDRT